MTNKEFFFKELYPYIYKRKSFHLFHDTISLTTNDIEKIKDIFDKLIPLNPQIKVAYKLVLEEETTCKRGAEYCILLYSEEKDNYLTNIGYLGEQLDLYLTSLGIGTLWFGIGKPLENQYQDLTYIIMLGIAKVEPNSFRKDMFKSKRKDLSLIWDGAYQENIGNICRFAPSACNSQPWFVKANDNELIVYRYYNPQKRGIMPKNKVTFYNKIDIGIFLYFLELCLINKGFSYERELYIDNNHDNDENTSSSSLLYINSKYKLQLKNKKNN